MPSSARPLRTLSIGGATFDLFLRLQDDALHACSSLKGFAFPFGGKMRVEDVAGTCGGGAANTAVGLARLGCKAAFSGPLGDDEWGEAIRKTLQHAGVDLVQATVIEGEPSSFSVILLSPQGERSVLVHKSMDRHFHDVTFDREAAANADALYLTHLAPESTVIGDDLVSLLQAQPDMHCTWNPGGSQIETGLDDPIQRALAARTAILQLNREEALMFTRTRTPQEALQVLRNAGVRIACITDGRNGAMATDGAQVWHCPSLPCPVRDTTGAGDAFGIGMTWAILRGKSLPEALKAGTMNAMSVVGTIGAQPGLLTETQIEAELARREFPVTAEPI